MNFNEVLEEVKQDWKAEVEKNKTIEGYGIIRKLYQSIPNEFKDHIRLKDDALFFSYQRLGKVKNITDVMIEDMKENIEEDMTEKIDLSCLDKSICILRKYGDPVLISFEFGKNQETGEYEYINYTVRIDQIQNMIKG